MASHILPRFSRSPSPPSLPPSLPPYLPSARTSSWARRRLKGQERPKSASLMPRRGRGREGGRDVASAPAVAATGTKVSSKWVRRMLPLQGGREGGREEGRGNSSINGEMHTTKSHRNPIPSLPPSLPTYASPCDTSLFRARTNPRASPGASARIKK